MNIQDLRPTKRDLNLLNISFALTNHKKPKVQGNRAYTSQDTKDHLPCKFTCIKFDLQAEHITKREF